MAKKPKLTKEQKAVQKEQNKGKRVWKLLGSTSATFAGIAAGKALAATWKTATGRDAPDKPENPALRAREALIWSAFSGMAIALAKTYATRRAAAYWVKSTGRLPPGMPEEQRAEAIAELTPGR